jgi:hypothetical protein
VIASHVIASTRVYTLGFGCGMPVRREHDSEFTGAAADACDLIASVYQLRHEISGAFATLAPEALECRLRPAPELWGTGPVREISAREAIVESIQHASLHLGELRLTRDLARASG